jgi:hypothetical protein
MKIHLAHENVDAELELIPTHRKKQSFRKTPDGKDIINQKFILFDIEKRNDKVLKENQIFDKFIEDDFDIDIELTGKYIKSTNRIVVNKDFRPVYNYMRFDILKFPDGSKKERVHLYTHGNTNHDIPVKITDDLIDPKDLLLKYIFRKSYYISHTNGLTFKFLFDLAKRLHNSGKFARVEAYDPDSQKRSPLVLYDGGRKFPRAFLEGRVKKNAYALILHISDQELIIPSR